MSQLAVKSASELMTISEHFVKSGYFKDANDVSKAFVKVMTGQDLGISAMAAMTGIHIVEGKPVIGANIMAAKIKQSGRYNYRVREHDSTVCDIVFFEYKEEIGYVRYTLEEAKASGVCNGSKGMKANWRRHPDDMLFARCISKGARRYCPDLFVTGAYTPDEFDMDEDGVVDAEFSPAQPARATQVAQEASTPAPVAAKPQTITKGQVGIIAEALEAAKFPEDKEQRRDFIISVSGCEPVDAASQISYDCAQRVIDRIQSEGMDNLLAAWEAERAMEQEEAGQPASTATITPEEVAKLALDLGELIPEGSTDFVDTWLAANCPDVVDIYGLSHAEAMSLMQAAREYSALEAAA